MNTLLRPLPAVAAALLLGATLALAHEQTAPGPDTYCRDVLPILMGKCSRCHNPQSILPNWLNYKTAQAHRMEIKRRVWDSWKARYFKEPMPVANSPECEQMTATERAIIKNWAEAGGVYGVPVREDEAGSKAARVARGEKLFHTICAFCHQPNAQGLPGKFPPLAASDFLNADKLRAIRTVLNGRQGEVVVNGHQFNNSMPTLPLTDRQVADVLTYVYNSFGNSGKEVTAKEVKLVRSQPVPPEDSLAMKKSPTAQPAEANPYE